MAAYSLPMIQLCLLMATLALAGAQVYQWVDTNGQRHFSDTPQPGWEPVEISVSRPSSTPAPLAVPQPARPPERESGDGSLRYEAVAIRSPAQGETLWNIEGQLSVATEVTPPLQQGHFLFLYLDDQPVARLGPGDTVARLSGVWRGEHTLRAQVLDAQGQSLAQSPPVRFVVQQTSIANPQNPQQTAPAPAPAP